jgi:CheY-like chemotaxis protein
MHGKNDVVSTLGVGTNMIVSLPIEFADASVLPVDEDEQSNNGIAVSDLRVLIVDDVEMNCMMLEGMLEALEVKECHIERDGHLAVERIEQDDSFDVVLMDVRMPTMDGLEATKQIRKLGFTNPIIAVTANAFEDDKESCLAAGMNGFLAKPVNLEALQEILAEVSS